MKIAEMSNKNRHAAVKKLTEASVLSALEAAQAKPKVIVTVHTSHRGCFWDYSVAAGKNPFGPRGGACGAMVDGKWVLGNFKDQYEAANFAERYAKANGYEYQPR